ncbi:metallophosphoesterase domain-containing protein 1-like [Histomonas meleagridis]|uniref:metallophosphoesterase domain-containing protein 1-like n=1 Tax=Histomonas meleagridis TaxID=135588 RepID=UPI00355AB670|nr:metallophosphoesterase domain-containing protein 1-like [Histomonas meleagridis]KAH0799485.1 metallophosphoesterase domain-containing protein 1-like [Histomonas meleagridis]
MSKFQAIQVTDFSTPKPENAIRVFCFSDTHGLHADIPREHIVPADIGIMVGDFTGYGNVTDVDSFRDWYLQLPFTHKIVIAGNHEISFDEANRESITPMWNDRFTVPVETIKSHIYHEGLIYAEHSTIELMGLKIFCSPYTPFFCNWAFPVPSNDDKFWDAIPYGTDIIATHGPPRGILDITAGNFPVNCGDPLLARRVSQVKPALHIFGHIHETYGIKVSKAFGTTFANVSVANFHYKIVNKPFVFDMVPK